MSDADAALWVRVRAGDQYALGALFDLHEARLFRHARRLLTSREDAKDAVTIAFFELWRKRLSVRLVDGSPLPGLLNTVSNCARNLERSARRYRALIARTPDEDHRAAHGTYDDSGVLAALKRLPPREQSVIVLTVLEGYPDRAAAEALGIPVGTVKSRLARAKGEIARRDDSDGGIMGLNDSGLSPREHAEMRDLVVAGTQRIKPAGAHRNRFVATAVALVLVGAVTGGTVATAAILGTVATAPVSTPSPTVPPTPTTTPTPTATPTQIPTPPPAPAGVLPFGGSCDNALTLEEVGDLLGTPVIHSDPRWPTGEIDVLGGINCQWSEASPSSSLTLTLAVYPEDVVPDAYRTSEVGPVCEQREGWDPSATPCTLTGLSGSTWYSLAAFPGLDDPAALADVGDVVAARIAEYGPPVQPVITADWWETPDCSWLDANADLAAAVGWDSQQMDDPAFSVVPMFTNGLPRAAGAVVECTWLLQKESESVEISVRVVPGGASALEKIAASPEAAPIFVPGAVSATTAEDNDFWEWYWAVLAASDGTNLVIVKRLEVDGLTSLEVADLAPLTSELLAVLGG